MIQMMRNEVSIYYEISQQHGLMEVSCKYFSKFLLLQEVYSEMGNGNPQKKYRPGPAIKFDEQIGSKKDPCRMARAGWGRYAAGHRIIKNFFVRPEEGTDQ